MDFSKVKIGQPANVSIDAFPGIKMDGKVTAISPMSKTQGRLVNYSVTVTLSIPSNIEVRAGMNATAKITITTPSTQSTAQSPNLSRSTQPAQPIKSTVPGSTSSGTPITTPTNVASSTSVAISSRGSVATLIYGNLYFGTGGKIEKLSVKRGDRVTKGAVMAKLDTASLEAVLAQAKVALDQAQLAKTQATTSLQAAQTTLDKTKLLADTKAKIINLQWQIRILQMTILDPSITNGSSNFQQIAGLTTEIAAETKAFSTLLAQPELAGVVTFDIVNAKYDTLIVEDTNTKTLQIQSAQQTVDKAQDVVDQAQKNLNLVQKQLNEAIIKAPFDGLVADVNYNEGDMLTNPSPAQQPVIYLIDPGAMAVTVSVNELDVPTMKIGQRATVSIDAFPSIKLEGKVSVISAVPIVRGGIVDYNVTIILSIPPNVEVRAGMNASAQIQAN